MTEQFSVYLRKSNSEDIEELDKAFDHSVSLHNPWAYAPKDIEKYSQQPNRYLACLKITNEIVGSFCISEIVRGGFQSAYLGYEAFVPHQGKGFMSQGLKLLLIEAFEVLGLHRIEANIQPENKASIQLVSKAGFVKEGFSPQYLRIGGKEWKDHERWAIINQNWSE